MQNRLDALDACSSSGARSRLKLGLAAGDEAGGSLILAGSAAAAAAAAAAGRGDEFGARGKDVFAGGMPLSCVGRLTIATPSSTGVGSSIDWPVALGPGAPALIDLLPRLAVR